MPATGRIFVSLALGAVLVGAPYAAQAGFEFQAPKAKVQPRAVSSAPIAQPQQIAPFTPTFPVMNAPMAVPAAPVMREPLMPKLVTNKPAPRAPTSYNPAPIMAPNYAPTMPVAPVIAPVRKTSHSLVINPYPLRHNKTAQMQPSHRSVARGMAEQGGALTPVQLGGGMDTGAKARPAEQVALAMPHDMYSSQNDLTPIPGGEGVPLPGILPTIEDAYKNSQITAQDIPVLYANAVGFGRDIPVEIALSQIIPDGFSYKVNGSLNKSAPVAWEGGKPWNIVLNDVLAAQNMTAIFALWITS